MTKIIIYRGDNDEDEIGVEVEGIFYRGEAESKDSPGEPGYVIFESATVNGEPFELTDDEKSEAESAILKDIKDELPIKWQRICNI